MTDKNHFLYLLHKYVEGSSTCDEYDEFFSMLLTGNYDELVKENMSNDFHCNLKSEGDLPPHIAQEIVRNILSADNTVQQLVPVKKNRRYVKMAQWFAAASVIAIIIFFAFFKNTARPNGKFVSIIPTSDIVKENNTQSVQKQILPDGSIILLQPGSKVHYPAAFKENFREIYLEGNAHFDVSHNPEKPFIVYCNNIVTKVLGTSFDIYTDKKSGNIEVAVKTGRVQVYENEKIIQAQSTAAEAVILTANQRVVYSNETRKIIPTLVANPVPLASKVLGLDSVDLKPVNHIPQRRIPDFIYDQQNLEKVFDDIQIVYGIDVVVENSNLNNCVFTGDVSNKDLFVLLKIICLSTNSDYEVMGTKILIKGKGCTP